MEEMSYLRQVIHDANSSFSCCNVIESNREVLLFLPGDKKMKSQRGAPVLNQPCSVISYEKRSSCSRLGMLQSFRYFSCHIQP